MKRAMTRTMTHDTKHETIRYWDDGWIHAVLVRRGRKWVVIRELFKRRNKEGKMIYRKRRIRLEMTAEPLWEGRCR
jgi:hypothetical protein